MKKSNLGGSVLRTFAMSALAASLFSCGSSDLPEYFLLDRFRVIAAVASAPEVAPSTGGITVAFHVSDPNGNGRTLTYSIEKCVDPGIGLGATPTCDGNPTAATVENGTVPATTSATNFYGSFTTAAFSAPSSATMFTDPATGLPRSTADQYNGVGYLVVATISASATESVKAFKRIVVSTKGTKNQNPSFNATPLYFDGVSPGAYSLTTTRFPVVSSVPPSSVEAYSALSKTGGLESATEKLTVTWLVTSGVMRYSRTGIAEENRFTPANPLPTKTSFIAVLRDDRGGEAIVDFHK